MPFNVKSVYDKVNDSERKTETKKIFNVKSLYSTDESAEYNASRRRATNKDTREQTDVERSYSEGAKSNQSAKPSIISDKNKLPNGADNAMREMENINASHSEMGAVRKEDVTPYEVYKKYNIDPDNFTLDDLDKWAKSHNFEVRQNGEGFYYAPKYEGGFLGFGGKKKTTDEEDKEFEILKAVADNNARRKNANIDMGKFGSAMVGVGDVLSFGMMSGAIKLGDKVRKNNYKKLGLDEDTYAPMADTYKKTVESHPIANAVGNIAGGIIPIQAVSGIVSSAVKNVPWVAKSAPWVQRAISDGITFGVINGTRTAFQGGTAEDVILNAARGAVSSAAGGALSTKAEQAITSLLTNPRYMNSFLGKIKDLRATDYVKNTIVGLTDATGDATGDAIFSLATGGDMRKPIDIATDFVVTTLFGIFQTAANSKSTSKQNRENLEILTNQYVEEYNALNQAARRAETPEGFAEIGEEIIRKGNNLKSFLRTHIFTGQSNEVKQAVEIIEHTNNRVRERINEVAGDTYNRPKQSNPINNNLSKNKTVPYSEIPTQNTLTDNVNAPNNPIKSNTSAELNEIANSEPIKMFAPKTANSDIKKLENILIAQGSDDASRQEIVATAVEVEKTLAGTGKTIRSVFDDTAKITSGAVSEIKNKTGASGAFWKLFCENFKAIPSGNVTKNVELIKEYTTAYTQALKNSNPQKYNSVMLSADGTDLAAELPQTIMQNIIPANVQNAGEYQLAAAHIKNIISDVGIRIGSERAKIYGANAKTAAPIVENAKGTFAEEASSTPSKNVRITQVGDFYEAYGNDAVELARKLNLTPTTKTINGVKMQMVGFPVSSLDRYKNILGSNYNISVSDTSSATSINEQNMPVSTENTPVNEDVTNIDVDMAEGEILSLKHTKNVYSLFKGAVRVMVGKDVISDGFVAIPLTDEALTEVKKVAGNVIQDNPNFELSKIYHKDNDVLIQGNPKTDEISAKKKVEKAYVFKIGNAFYTCQQKYIDAFNNGKNIIAANKRVSVPWTVHNENGEFVALFLGADHTMNDERFNSLQSVSEIKTADKQKKAENADKPFNQNEVRQIFDAGRPFFSTVHGVNYVGEGHIFVVCDENAAEFIKNEYRKQNANSNYEIEHKDGFGGMVEKMLSEAKELAEAKDPISYSDASPNNRADNAYIIGDYAIVFNKNYANIIKKRSKDMKIISNGSMSSTILVGYDADGNIAGFALPILAKGNVTTKDGKSIPFVGEADIKRLVKEAAANETKSDKSVIEKSTATKKDDVSFKSKSEATNKSSSLGETSPIDSIVQNNDVVNNSVRNNTENDTKNNAVGQLLEDYSGAVDGILAVSDETAKEFADKRIAVEVLKNTPNVILDNVEDAKDLKVIINYNKLYLAVRKSGVFKGHYHNLGADIAKRLPEFLKKPDAIIQLANGRLNLFATVETKRGNNGIISVELNSTKDIGGKNEDYNVVVTLFSSDDNYAQNLILNDGVTVKYKREDLSQVNPQLYKWLATINDKSSVDNSVSQNNDVVNNSVRNNAENDTLNLTDKCELIATKHTATGNDIWVVTLKDRISSEEYKDLRGRVKAVGGYYSRYAKTPDGKAIPGFVFKTEPTANEIKVFNDFFDTTEETTPYDTQDAEHISAETKPDLQVGDVIELNGKKWRVAQTGFNMTFENLDKNDKEAVFSHIGGMENFKNTQDYTIVSKKASSEAPSSVEKNITETQAKNEDILNNQSESAIIEENTDKDGVKNVESQSEVLARESGADGGRLHAGADGTTEQETTEEDDGQHRKNSRETLSESTDADGNRPDVRNDSERVYGRNDAEDAVSEASGNGTELTEEAPETIDTVDKSVEKKRQSNKNNFIITDDIAAEFDNTRPSAEDNIAAIELLLNLENEGRPATVEEKKILAKYKGWGGIDTRNVSWALRQKMLNLFNGEQLRNMQTSTSSAFFTPTGVIDAMYNGLKRMGFKGGNVLESSMGVGNFFGRMPSAMSAKSALTGVELESYTARIAQYLYPGATVINKPFQDVAIKNGSFDMVIGNVPFGNEKIRYGKKSYALHNYFIISSLDKVRDGGVVAVITSAGTLDSYGMDARQAIMDRADVVACYKLPAGVFSRNASTDVQTDLLILRKRADGAKPVGDSILNVTTTADGLRLNEYFVKNPQNILGTLAKGTNAWGEITTVLDDGNFYDKLNKAMGKLPKGLISGNIDLKPIETIVTTSSKPRFFEKDGKIYADDGAGTATAIANGTKSQIVRDYMAVRDAYKELLAAYSNGETVKNADGTYSIREVSDADIKSLRESLSKAYDNFAKKHGAITGDGKKKLSFKTNTNRDNTFLEADADYYLVSGLEKYNTKAKQIEKSELFEKDTLKKKRITSVDTASDALIVSLNESGKVDFARMQELTGKTEKQLAEELKGEIVLTPDGDYVLTDVYLSGNIYEKLEKVKGKPEFKEQQEMLERVIPTPKDASSINIKLGANYIDTEYVEQFSREVFHERISVSKNSAGTWTVDGSGRSRYGDILNVKYGCEKFNAIQLLEKILNDSEITATDTIKQNGTSVTVYNPKMTEVARQKAEDIKSAFENWIFRDSERRTAIVDKYNRMYNNYRPLDFARIAEKLSFESMDEDLRAKLYPHQKKGIARALFGGNVLFAHGVGTGKTFEMIASVMEAKRMGIVNKTAMVVPNNKVVDFKNDIAQAYPNAKVLVIDTANKKRQTMLGLVNSNDWDIVLVGKNTFTKIPVGAELQANYINEQVEELDKQITEAQFDRNTSKREMNRLTKLRDGLLRKLETLNSETKRDENGIEFEKLGFDCICVDEAHNYKSIITPSRLNIKGLSKDGSSQQANDMLMKLDYMRSIDGKIIFGTGTPITNTVSEIYNMMRMVRPDILEDAGIHSLDEWVNTFANIETQTEVGIDGRIKDKSTQIIKSFFNATEMIGMYRQFADVVFTDDVVKDLPDIEFIPVEIEGTEVHRAVQQAISKAIATAKGSEALSVYGKVMTMGSAAALDTRMLAGADSEYNPFKDYSVEELEYENSKVNVMCNYVLDNYKSFADIKGTQLIFCDGGAGTGDVYSFNVHKDIRQKLIELGIPENEIVIMKNQNDAQLEELYAKVNSGEVRVLIGTSAKMAEGLNVQERVVAIHYPTVTYNPADLEQSMARGRRKGNINKKVKIYRYLQGNTFDSYKWQALERKGEMINRALRGEAVDELEDVTADIDPATAMAITSGNPLVKEKIDIDKEVKRLKVLKQNYMNEHYRYEDAVAKNPGQIRQLTEYAQRIEQDIALRDKHSDKAEISVKGKSFEKQTDANKALSEAVKTAPKNGQYTKLGTYNGFDIMFKGDTGGMGYSLILKGANEYSVEYAGSGNNIARIAGALNRLDTELQRVQSRVKTLKTDLEFAKKEVSKPFEKEKELTEALERQKDITYRYEHYGEKTATAENAETEKTESSDTVHSSRDTAKKANEKNVPIDTGNATHIFVNTNEIPVKFTNVNEARKAFVDYVRENFPKSVININTQAEIGISRMGIDKFLSGNISIQKYTTGFKIPELIESAVKIGEAENKKGKSGINGYEYYNNLININGKDFAVHIRVRNTDMGDKYYGHTISQNVEDIKIEPLAWNSDKKSVHSINASSSNTNNISQNDVAVNNNSAQKSKGYSNTLHNDEGSYSSKDIAGNDSTSRWTTERVEGNKDSKVNIADIVKVIRDKFGIPVATGKVTDREASGIYKDKPETIRTRIANNLPTISHELGHHLDKKYDLSKLESVQELRKVVSKEFLEQYPANEKNREAVAEFVRIYLKNANDANRLCPDFYSDFVSTLSKEDLKAFNEIASSVNEYLSYNISERYDAAIVSSQKKEKLPFRDRWSKWYSDWVDAFHPQKQAVDYVEDVTGQTLSGKNNAYILATNSLNAHTIANYLICEGFRDLDGNVVDAKSFVDSIGMVDSKNVKLLDKYLVLRHSLEWIAPEQEDVTAKRVFADDTLENVEEIKKQIAEIEKAHPEIKTAAENLYEYQNNVIKHFVIPAGGMTEETLSTLNRKYPSYVPFYRAVGKKSGFAKGTFANQRSPIMRAKGSGALIISPTESIIRNTEKMVKFAMRNQVMGMWAYYADTVDGFGQFMEKVAPDMIPHFTDITSQKERFTDALQQAVSSGEDYFAVSDLFDEIFGNAVADFTPVANANKKIVTVLKAGTPSYYQIHDDAFYNSVAELSPQQTSGLLRVINTIMQPMKLLITQNNPIFAVTNALRDFGTAYKLSEINNPVTFATQYVKALGGIIANSESYKQYKAMGGGHSSELSANIESISKTLRKVAQKDMGKARRLAYSIFIHPVETVASINDAIESVPRFAEFQRTLKADGDLQEAIFNASDITTNFKRSGKGDTAKAVNKLIMFNNAAIQGLDKTFRTITAKDPKKRYKTLLKWLLYALITSIIRYLYNKEVDEEGYKNLSSYKKNNFYNYAIGDGKFISLPKPRENALLDTVTERTIEYLFGDNEEAFYDFGSYLGLQLLPPMLPDNFSSDSEHSSIENAFHSWVGSTVFGGLADIGFNQDFKGTPIESKYDKYLQSNERYNENTSKLAYELGQTKFARDNNLSPKKIDHLISSYTGILGQVNKALFPINDSRRDTSIGLRNKFISDSNYSTDVLNRMYENQEKAEKAFNYSGSVSDAIEYEKNSVITSYISGMNKAVKALPEDEQRSGRAYLLKALNSWNYDDSTSQLSMLSSLDGSTVSKDVIFNELPSSSLEWTVDKQKYVYQMTPQEYHKYISDYLTVIENARKHYGGNTVESYEAAKEAAKDYMSDYKKNVLKEQYLRKAVAKTE